MLSCKLSHHSLQVHVRKRKISITIVGQESVATELAVNNRVINSVTQNDTFGKMSRGRIRLKEL